MVLSRMMPCSCISECTCLGRAEIHIIDESRMKMLTSIALVTAHGLKTWTEMKGMAMMKVCQYQERQNEGKARRLIHIAICPLDYESAGLIIDDESESSAAIRVPIVHVEWWLTSSVCARNSSLTRVRYLLDRAILVLWHRQVMTTRSTCHAE